MPKLRLDWWLVIPSLLLFLIGILTLSAIAPEVVTNQLIFFVVGLVFFLVCSVADYTLIFSFNYLLYIFSLIFLITPFIFGAVTRGATRWIQLGQFTLQPSEIIKPFLLIFFAFLAVSSVRYKYLWLILSAALPAVIIFFQPDLGTALVLIIGWFTIFLSKVRLKFVLSGILLFLIMLMPIYKFVLKDYQRTRLITFINPYNDPLGNGYHAIQSIIATGSGMFMGRGLGRGTQSLLRFLPERHTDFMFASLSESLGFVGSTLVICLYLVLLWRVYRISQHVSDPVASLFCMAVMALIAFQVFVNIGMNIGLMPITGITLPFLSYGGSSLLSMSITLGLVNSISKSSDPHYYSP